MSDERSATRREEGEKPQTTVETRSPAAAERTERSVPETTVDTSGPADRPRPVPDKTRSQISEVQSVPDGEASEPNVPTEDVDATSTVEPVDPTIRQHETASWRDKFLMAIAGRNLVAARDMLDPEKQQEAVVLRLAEVRMAERLVESQDRFWEEVESALLMISDGDVIRYLGEEVTITSIQTEQLTWITPQGVPRTSALDAFQMDPDLAVVLAGSQLSSSGSHLWNDIGVFLTLDGQGFPSRGLQYLRDRREEGGDQLLEAIDWVVSRPRPAPGVTAP
jgi:hypothetical protein